MMVTPSSEQALIEDSIREYIYIKSYTKKLINAGVDKGYEPFKKAKMEKNKLEVLERITLMQTNYDQAEATMGLPKPTDVEMAAFQKIIDVLKSKFTTTQQVREAIDTTIDANQDGVIQFSEFNNLVKDSGLTELQIKQMYNVLDEDQNSFLTCLEFKNFVGTL